MSLAQPATDPLVRVEQDDGIATVTLNRPGQYNAMSMALLTDLDQALAALGTDPEVRVIILAASGKAFCAGHDLKEIRSSDDPDFHRTLFELCSQVMLRINRQPQPVIAQVQGIATAAGCQLVAACDLAVAADDARFATSGINLGFFCGTPGVALSRALSRKHALELLLTGRFIDAGEALAKGLVNRVVPLAELASATRDLAAVVAAKLPVAVQEGKKLFYRQLEASLEDAYEQATKFMVCNLTEPDTREGLAAFIEKRPPNWR